MLRIRRIIALCINLLFICGFILTGYSEAHQNKGIHAIGDGNICVYEQNSDIVQLFGAPYSSPSAFCLKLTGTDSVKSDRIPGSAIWKHQIIHQGVITSTQTDFISSEAKTFIRMITSSGERTYELTLNGQTLNKLSGPGIAIRPWKENHQPETTQSFLIEVKWEVPLMFSYLPPEGRFYMVRITGNAKLTAIDSVIDKLQLRIFPGTSSFLVTAGESIGDLEKNIKVFDSYSLSYLFSKAQKQSQEFSAVHQKISVDYNDPGINKAIDDISFLIKSQQGAGGGVLAGHAYHMGYVRDQYGVARGLLAMGHFGEAKKILEFYFTNWKESGYIKNAQAIGFPHIFHRHENDEVEITGYLVLQAMDYYGKTKNNTFIRKIMPMLEWAIDAQKRNLTEDMLPFNGDETYIAGGILPRKVMFNGSAESTLLFIEGANRLIKFIKINKLWPASKVAALNKIVRDCSNRYRDNFLKKGVLITNNPSRELKIQYPASRFGVCLHPGDGGYASEVFHFKGPLYFCKECLKKDNSKIIIPEPEIYNVVSVSLFPFYINAELFTATEKEQLLDHVVKYYLETGKISEKNTILGSDYGFFLDGLVAQNHELKDEIYQKMMNLRDETGAWVEYYDNGVPMGCKCRPWESGINIEAAIRYWEKKGRNK